MKAVLIPIKPKWCELILAGKKTIEVRKTKPKIETPFKCYICQSGKNLTKEVHGSDFNKSGYVVGEFMCDSFTDEYFELLEGSCLDLNELHEYANGKDIYGWCISNLVNYDKPKELSEFKKINRDCWYADLGLAKRDCPECKDENCFLSRPPQSWCYVEECETK